MSKSPFKILHCARSDVGRERENNEDRVLVIEPTETDTGWVLCVADGMGGHPAGEEASAKVVEGVANYPTAARNIKAVADSGALARTLVHCLERAHEAILSIGSKSPEKAGLGSTVVAAQIVGNTLHVFHCGDSRGYLLREDTLEQLTSDHVVVEDGVRYLAAHVGMAEGFVLEHAEHKVRAGDRILVCSDGLTDMLRAEVIGLALHEAPDPEQAVLTLIEMANLAGGLDNVSCAVAFVTS